MCNKHEANKIDSLGHLWRMGDTCSHVWQEGIGWVRSEPHESLEFKDYYVPCKLCGGQPDTGFEHVGCDNDKCPLFIVTLTQLEWNYWNGVKS